MSRESAGIPVIGTRKETCRLLGELIREAGLTACTYVSLTCEHCGKYRAIITGTNGHHIHARNVAAWLNAL